MNKISEIFKKINERNYNQGILILKLHCKKKTLNIINAILVLSLAISTYSFENLSANINLAILMTGILIIFGINIICDSDKLLLSVVSFLLSGILYYFAIISVMLLLIRTFVNNEMFDIYIVYIFASLYWWKYSLIANNKVATLGNEVISSFFAILLLIKDTLLTLISKEILNFTYKQITIEEHINIFWNVAISPILAINIIALIFCSIKGYWIEKYNNGKDLTEDMIPENQVSVIDVARDKLIHRK